MCSTLVSGAPEQVVTALTNPSSSTTLLGRAFQVALLQQGDGWQVGRRAGRSLPWTGCFIQTSICKGALV